MSYNYDFSKHWYLVYALIIFLLSFFLIINLKKHYHHITKKYFPFLPHASFEIVNLFYKQHKKKQQDVFVQVNINNETCHKKTDWMKQPKKMHYEAMINNFPFLITHFFRPIWSILCSKNIFCILIFYQDHQC